MVAANLDGNFNTDGELGLWSTSTSGAPGAAITVSGGYLNATMGLQTSGKYRADIWYNIGLSTGNDITLNTTNNVLMAIKFKGKRPNLGAIKFEMTGVSPDNTTVLFNIADWNKGFANGSFTDANGDVTYYFNLALNPLFTGGDLNFRRLHFTIADSPTETSYKVDWIATFPDTAAIEAYLGISLGVNNNQIANNDLKIYPNPSIGNSFNLDLGNSSSESNNVKIYDLLGKLVLEKDFAASASIQVNHNLIPGVYIVKVNNTTNIKLVIK